MKRIIYFLTTLGVSSCVHNSKIAQNNSTKFTANNKGKFYIHWGVNRSFYSNSVIKFVGKDFNFVVENATAHDKPKSWHIDYINPTWIIIPQTNLKIDYYFSDKYSVSIGVDHMKYVMTPNQEVIVNGEYPYPGASGELLSNGKIQLIEEFLMFEHTDGLNYVHTEIAKTKYLSKYLGISDTDKIQFNALVGIGAGILYPKTKATL